MGGVVDFINDLCSWIGDSIASVVKWFVDEVRDLVMSVTKTFLQKNEEKIKKTEKPTQVAKVVGAKKAVNELEKFIDNEERQLSSADMNAVNDILSGDPEFMKL